VPASKLDAGIVNDLDAVVHMEKVAGHRITGL
jgi:hypothetical protein